MNLSENETIKYRVVYDGSTLLEAVPRMVAEQFVANLAKNVRENVIIIPVTDGGQQVLLG